MQIRRMRATFGKLNDQTLELSPGLNVLYAPNETGKSTWVAFLADMFYGLSTKSRGMLADKNRFAPWGGQAMQGQLELTVRGRDYTVLRRTARANAPMGDFSCTFSGTATEVPGIDRTNLGDLLLGVPREVFERSALVRQTGLAVDQDAALEKRIAALITTGEEDTSFTETYQCLKGQLNSRRHNKTGQIPALERELALLDSEIGALRALTAQEGACSEQLAAEAERRAELERQQALWACAEAYRQAEAYRTAREALRLCQERESLLAELSGTLPPRETLEQCAGQLQTLQHTAQSLAEAQRSAAEKNTAVQAAETALRACPDAADAKAPLHLPLLLASEAAAFGAVFLLLNALGEIRTTHLLLAALLCAVFLLPWLLLRRRELAHHRSESAQLLARRTGAQDAYDAAKSAAAQAGAAETYLSQAYRSGRDAILTTVRRFEQDAADLPGAQAAVLAARQRLRELEDARAKTREARLRLEVLPEVEAQAPEQTPQLSRQETARRLQQSDEALRALQSRLDSLRGQIRSAGNLSDLESQRQQKLAARDAAQGEYDALSLAMEALEQANLTLQNRFSPQLGAKAAEIFARLTGGAYEKVLLNRDFSLAAEAAGDPARRDIQLLSQGAADQLYLAVRLAICQLVLPEEPHVPLVLDDALLSFDEARCRAALEYLAQESQTRQILLFTCQKREAAYLGDRAARQTLG